MPHKPKSVTKRLNYSSNSMLMYLGMRPTPFEFAVDESIEVCIKRLQGMDDRRGLFGTLVRDRSIEVDISSKNAIASQFTIVRNGGYGVQLTAVGQLESLSEYSTLVKVSVEPYNLSFEFAALLGLSLLILSLALFNAALLCAFILLVLAFGITIVSNASYKDAFIRSIRNALSYPGGFYGKKKKE